MTRPDPAAPRRRRGPGLRPTLRQHVILVGYAALVLATVAALVPGDRARVRAWSVGVGVVVCLSLPVLGLMIRLLDRPGLMRSWLSGFLFAAFLPMVAGLTVVRCVVDVFTSIVFPKPDLSQATAVVPILFEPAGAK